MWDSIQQISYSLAPTVVCGSICSNAATLGKPQWHPPQPWGGILRAPLTLSLTLPL